MRDLTNQLTIFVIAVGNDPNYSPCINALKKQTCKFTLNIIRDYSPMSVAFQEMLNRCKTPYFIQVDQDMIVQENAIEKMWCEIEGNNSPENISMHCYRLRDVHLDFPIYGIKIYKTDIFKKYPYNLSHPSAEVEQLERMKKDGYDIVFKKEIVGEHSPHWTIETIFERYYNLMQKFRIYRYLWLEKLPVKLWSKIRENPSTLNMYAYAGALAGLYSDEIINKEKDSRLTNKYFGRLHNYFTQPHQCTLYLTSKCNYLCNFCWRQYQELEKFPDMTSSMVEIIINKFPSIQGYCICGFGENLLSPNLIPILKVLKSAKKTVGLISNGSLITKKLSEINGWYKPDYISVSLNAHNKEEHKKVTGTDTWDDVINGIKLLVSSPIECYVSSVVTQQNIDKLPKLIKFINSLGVKTVHLHNLLPHFDISKNKNFWNEVLWLPEHGQKLDVLSKMPESNIIKKYPVLIDKSGGKGACQFPYYSIAINGNGSISYCNSCLPCDKKYGNINDFVVWNSPEAQKFRDKFFKNELPHCNLCFRNWLFDGRIK